ncbi:Hypothetical protein A7982_11266 [Minicystis rosea]|nr:Hypothetical protein A7982_11266 [Minicystis rosea]
MAARVGLGARSKSSISTERRAPLIDGADIEWTSPAARLVVARQWDLDGSVARATEIDQG